MVSPIIAFILGDNFSLGTISLILLFIITYAYLNKGIFIKTNIFKNFAVLFILFLGISGISFLRFYPEFDVIRFAISVCFLLILLLGSYLFSKVIAGVSTERFNKIFHTLFIVFIIIAASSFFTKSFFPLLPKAMFPFKEPSHFGVFFGPILCYNVIAYPKRRIYYILAAFAISILVESLTLMVAIVCLLSFVYKMYILPIALLAGGFLLYSFGSVEYFTSRFDSFSEDTTNMSVLVYIKGWELAREGFGLSNGLGVGFQQLGYVNIDTPTRSLMMQLMDGQELNARDGGLTAAKLIAEFGFFGIVTLIMYLIFLVKLRYKYIKNKEIYEKEGGNVLLLATLVSFFIELFVRGMGYFLPTTFLFLSALFLFRSRQNQMQ